MTRLLIAVLLVITLCTSAYADCASGSSSGLFGGGLFARLRERRQARREARAERRLGASSACAESACASACDAIERSAFEIGCSALAATLQQETMPSVLAKAPASKVPCILVSDSKNSKKTVLDSAKLITELQTIIRGRNREV